MKKWYWVLLFSRMEESLSALHVKGTVIRFQLPFNEHEPAYWKGLRFLHETCMGQTDIVIYIISYNNANSNVRAICMHALKPHSCGGLFIYTVIIWHREVHSQHSCNTVYTLGKYFTVATSLIVAPHKSIIWHNQISPSTVKGTRWCKNDLHLVECNCSVDICACPVDTVLIHVRDTQGDKQCMKGVPYPHAQFIREWCTYIRTEGISFASEQCTWMQKRDILDNLWHHCCPVGQKL